MMALKGDIQQLLGQNFAIFDPPPQCEQFLSQYTNKTVMRIGGLILNLTKFFPLFESADVLALPNSSH